MSRLVIAIALLAGSTAMADPTPEQTTPLALRATVRGISGVGSRDGLGLGIVAIGGDVHITPSLTLTGQLVGQHPFGTIAEGRPSAFGFGGELVLREVLLPDASVRPYLLWNLGIQLFLGRPFLPGGDVYDFMVGVGVGAEIDVTRTQTIAVEAFMLHESNGQGLGSFNPAFDGFGVGVSTSWSERAIAPIAADRPREPAYAPTWPGVFLDGVIGQSGGDVLGTGRLVVAVPLAGLLGTVVDVEGGMFAGERLLEGGAALVLDTSPLTVGVHLGHRDYAGLETEIAAAQGEWHATPSVTLLGLVHFERGDLGGNRWRAGVGLRSFVWDSLMVQIGIGFDDLTSDRTFQDNSDPFVGFEWRLPVFGASDAWQLSLYGERQISTLDVAGLRLGWNTRSGHARWHRVR
jgi:hypothetical protein